MIATRLLPCLGAILLSAVFTSAACSSSTEECKDADCLPGNKCIAAAGETKCRKPCSSNVDPTRNCPFNYTCIAQAPEPFCVKDAVELKKAKGQWGEHCLPTGGILTNPDCDSAQEFYCYATRKSDGDAYCTRFGCTKDSECGAGFYCGDANVSPNAESDTPDPGNTQKVCLRRTYCSPCKVDLDCPSFQGRPQKCVPGDDGVPFCALECATKANCQKDARCAELGDGAKVCYPLAGKCVGDGSLCSPCRSDADCKDGACVKGQYTEERSCAVKSAKPCTLTKDQPQKPTDYDCPPPSGGPTAKPAVVRCLGGDPRKGWPFNEVPQNYCHGLYGFAESADVGCWTPAE